MISKGSKFIRFIKSVMLNKTLVMLIKYHAQFFILLFATQLLPQPVSTTHDVVQCNVSTFNFLVHYSATTAAGKYHS
jgi:hypothetical protein